ncbi:hypothetical protein VF21_10384 [Pseudogymnoascus sp. 05NY08]|nr:hypothetical protein VF21_10384 [Pseudogymnoascus sp. 05NY08]
MHDNTNSIAIVSGALMIDASLTAWAAENTYGHNTVPLMARSDAVFADYYHTYTSILTAASWNSYRSARILLNELLIVQLSYLSQSQSQSQSQYQAQFVYEDEDMDFPHQAEDSAALLQEQYNSQIFHSRAVIAPTHKGHLRECALLPRRRAFRELSPPRKPAISGTATPCRLRKLAALAAIHGCVHKYGVECDDYVGGAAAGENRGCYGHSAGEGVGDFAVLEEGSADVA